MALFFEMSSGVRGALTTVFPVVTIRVVSWKVALVVLENWF